MGVDISVWRCRIGTFNASIHRSSGKRVKKSLTLPGGNGVPVVILAAAILLLVVAGEVRYCQRYKHPGSTLLSVPFCAGGSALAHRSRDAVTPAVTVLSKATTQEVIRPLCPVTINFDQIPERGRYAILHPVALSGRETLGELMNVTMP